MYDCVQLTVLLRVSDLLTEGDCVRDAVNELLGEELPLDAVWDGLTLMLELEVSDQVPRVLEMLVAV